MDAYLAGDADGAKADTIHQAVGQSRVPKEYKIRFEQTRQSFNHLGDRVRLLEATTQGRMVIGLGNKNVLEMGIRLDRTWGVPILPGSSLKGLASSVAHLDSEDEGWKRSDPNTNKRAGEHHAILFGTTDNSGAVIFHDAWWKWQDGANPLAQDVMTVHHAGYYQDDTGTTEATDFDSPTPISFVTAQGTFLIALELMPGADVSWLDAAEAILKRGLEEYGLGAKTNAGYGRMTIPDGDAARHQAGGVIRANVNDTDSFSAYMARANTIVAGTASALVDDVQKSQALTPLEKSKVAKKIIEKLGTKFIKTKADKPYVKWLVEAGAKA